MNNEELNTIIDKSKSDSIKDKLIYSRKFLSFSSLKDVAENFIKDKYIQKKNELNYILFKINPYEGNIDDAKCYNIEKKKIILNLKMKKNIYFFRIVLSL